MNGLTNVEILEVAVVPGTNAEKVAQLRIPSMDHYAAPAGGFLADEERSVDTISTVLVRTIESHAVFGGRDLIKLDVEGHEYKILSVVKTLLLRSKPTLFLEVLDEARLLRELLHEFCVGGYVLLVPTSSGLQRIDSRRIKQISLRRHFGDRDVILTADQRLLNRSTA